MEKLSENKFVVIVVSALSVAVITGGVLGSIAAANLVTAYLAITG
jgi:hypothetical protein